MQCWIDRPYGSACVFCVTGTYKIAMGDANCSNCRSAQFSTKVGATEDVCENCTVHSNSPDASDDQTDCTCNAGSTGHDGHPCVLYVAGKYKNTTGEAPCTECQSGQYSTALGAIADVCKECPADSHAPSASQSATNCSCNAGWSGLLGDTCVLCAPGTFSDLGASTQYRFVGEHIARYEVQMSEFQFFSSASAHVSSQIAVQTVLSLGTSSTIEQSPMMLVDGGVFTKWHTGGSYADDFNSELIFTFSSPAIIRAYQWYSANDRINRDPVSWRLEAMHALNAQWMLVHRFDDVEFVTMNRR